MCKKVFWCIGVFVVLFSYVAGAETIDDLREVIGAMRQEYNSKIIKLESKIEALTKRQSENVNSQRANKKESILQAEYVGRYEGPFEKGGLLIKNPSGFGNVSLGGYIDMEFENFQNTNSTFDQHRWIINIGAELTDRIRFFSEYEIEHGGPDSANNDGEAKVEQAWVDYLINQGINLRAGSILVPFGRYNIYHDSDLQDLTDRPLVNRDIIPTTWTESGAGIHGEIYPTIGNYEDLEIGYEFYIINGLDFGFSDTGLGASRGSLKSDNNNSKALVGRWLISPALGQEIGLSGYYGKYNNSNDAITGGAIDLLSVWGPLEFVGEYAYFSVFSGICWE